MKYFEDRVSRSVRWFVVSTLVVLTVILGMGYATIRLIVGIPQDMQAMFLYVFGCAGLAVAFLSGLAVNSILVRSWDTWLNDLGPTQIEVLVKEMEKRREQMEKEE